MYPCDSGNHVNVIPVSARDVKEPLRVTNTLTVSWSAWHKYETIVSDDSEFVQILGASTEKAGLPILFCFRIKQFLGLDFKILAWVFRMC